MEKISSVDLKIINKTQCSTIVKNDLNLSENEFDLKSYNVIKYSNGLYGFMGDYHKLTVEIQLKSNAAPKVLNYFVKSLPVANQVFRNKCKEFFRKESYIYANILPNIQRYATSPLYPKSYLACEEFIVLEDLSLPEKCLKQLENIEEYSMKHRQLYVQHLARLHAASLAWESVEHFDIGQKFSDILFELQLTSKNEWYTTGIKGVLYLAQTHPKYQYPEAQEFINQKLYNIFLEIEVLADPSTKLHNVLCHRDSWIDNIFWQYDDNTQEPIGCRIVDFQLMRYSPPAIDILNFLYNSFKDAEQRDSALPDLLKCYFNTFKSELRRLNLSDSIITQKEFDEDYRQALLPVLTLWAIYEPLMKLPKGWASMMRSNEPETFDIYMNSERTEMFKRVSNIDPFYLENILRPVQEIMEYLGFNTQKID